MMVDRSFAKAAADGSVATAATLYDLNRYLNYCLELLGTFEKQMSHQPPRGVRFFQKPWASAQRLIPKCDSYFSNAP